MRFPATTAIATSLMFTLVTRGAGSIQHFRQGTIDLRTVRWLATGSLPTAVVAALLAARLLPPSMAGTDQLRAKLVAGALFIAALLLTWKFFARRPGGGGAASPARLVAFGVLIGAMVAITSVGTGSIAMAGLAVLTPLGVARLVGTDMLHAALLAAVTVPVYALRYQFDLPLVLVLLAGSIPGVVLGSRLAYLLPERVTRLTVLLAVWSLALKLA